MLGVQGFPWPLAGLPVALLPCEEGVEQSSDAAQRTMVANSGSSFRNRPEAELALRCGFVSRSSSDTVHEPELVTGKRRQGGRFHTLVVQ